jgi:pSer/pThr/pTyr-binding forkhead associated (FHA) protein
MPVQLLALTDGPSILLDKPILLLGRHPECDIQLNSRKVSRRHCCVAQLNDFLVVRDLGSTNGIRINGNRVLEGRLKGGDELTIGNFKYQVCWDLPGEPISAPPKKKTGEIPFSRSIDELLESTEEPMAIDDESASQAIKAKRANQAKRATANGKSGDSKLSLPTDGSAGPK